MIVDNLGGLPTGDTDDPVLVHTPRDGIPHVVDSPEDLAEAAHVLARASAPVALDVERAQGFRYGSDPYLVQIRREDVGTVLVDTHALPDLRLLGPALSGTWILHSASQDLPNLRQVGLDTTDLFDTELAARLVGLDRFGLAAVCEQVLGLALVKDHQAANWSVRPLPKDWLRYAALDVELLTEARRRLAMRLHDLDRWEWATEEFDHVLHMAAPAPKVDRWRLLPGASKITSRRELAVLRELWEAREDVARRIDLAPGRLVRSQALVRAAQQPPRNRRALLSFGEFRSPVARTHVDVWLRAINRAVTMDEDDLPPKRSPAPRGAVPQARNWQRIDPEAHARLQAVRGAISRRAETLGIAQEVLLEPKVQRWVAWAPLDPSIALTRAVAARLDESDARQWQKRLVAGALADALS
ncbi:ribonuclease D [Schaalia sp. 19OD2882]|uniref:HRDC domain-containing protein n=1 Tax=Schaalia sp. 19OD2882 TaxID=2794089 RepID=UPI001C1ECBE4|nr:HRDC domain-containing protein [Schaalia sp. 19OD2882]QWW20443.1 ribonuclease D [Schaalia sp. 19OD2882]